MLVSTEGAVNDGTPLSLPLSEASKDQKKWDAGEYLLLNRQMLRPPMAGPAEMLMYFVVQGHRSCFLSLVVFLHFP